MQGSPKIAIVLPTFNGARFIGRQLDSVLAQSCKNIVIVVRDDGSDDNTLDILRSYQQSHPDQIHLVASDGINLGPERSFSLLLQYVLDNKRQLGLESAYVALCDQDDIWRPDKLDRQLQAMQAREAAKAQKPILVHSDLQVVNEDLTVVAESFLAYHGLDGRKNSLKNIIFSNTVTGCAALLNEPLLNKALPVPDGVMMHDWWLALVAAEFGEICFLPDKLVLYRQHADNTLGAREYIPARVFSRVTWKRLLKKNPDQMLFGVARQAGAFERRFSGAVAFRHRFYLKLAAGLRSESLFKQRVIFRLLRNL